jgi:hypothetical protein
VGFQPHELAKQVQMQTGWRGVAWWVTPVDMFLKQGLGMTEQGRTQVCTIARKHIFELEKARI